MRGWSGRPAVWADFVKFEHTVFALPFAYLGYILGLGGRTAAWDDLLWITLVMVGARTFGMTLNRIVDRKIDARNPRTAQRPLVTGRVSLPEAWFLAAASFVLFAVSAFHFGALCGVLFFPALGLLVLYHYLKRFTWFCHYGIGAVLACAPAGGWVVAAGEWDGRLLPLALAVMLWTAGFDLLYSLQDEAFDRESGLHSVPSRYGKRAALTQSRICHAATLGMLIFLGIILRLKSAYFGIVAGSALVLVLEHWLVERDSPKHLNTVFFTLNGIFSTVFCLAVILFVSFNGGVKF